MAEYPVPNEYNADPSPGRTLYLEELRRTGIADDRSGQPGGHRPAWDGERVMPCEGDVEDEEMRAAKESLANLEAGRIGPDLGVRQGRGEG